MSESCDNDEEANVFERGKEYRKPHTKILKNAKSHNYSGISSRSYAGAGYSLFNWAGPNKRSCAYHEGRYIAHVKRKERKAVTNSWEKTGDIDSVPHIAVGRGLIGGKSDSGNIIPKKGSKEQRDLKNKGI